MSEENKIKARDTVGLVLMGSEESDVAVEMLREEQPNLRITKTNCYWMIEGEGKIEVDVAAVGERLGRDLDMSTFLVVMTSYYGRAQVTDNTFGVYSEMLQLEESSQ
ncbi:MAG: monooxygenase [Deltaproteobacteria bacterium]|nr:monooxygenase [Deltaproteobacteria bacterium]